MTDQILASEVIVNAEDGREIARWTRFTPAEFIGLSKWLRKRRKDQLRDNLQLAGVNGREALRLLNESDARRISHGDTIQIANDLEGQVEIIATVLRRQKKDAGEADVFALGIEPEQWQKVAAELLGAALVTLGEDGRPLLLTGGNQTANPDPTATGGQTPTGSEASSASRTP